MITEKLARFVTETCLADVPQDVIAGARGALIDTLGCALAGTLEPAGEIALRWVRESAGNRRRPAGDRTRPPPPRKPPSRMAEG